MVKQKGKERKERRIVKRQRVTYLGPRHQPACQEGNPGILSGQEMLMEREMPVNVPGWWSGTGGLPNPSSSVQHGGFMILTAHLCGRLITQVSSTVNEKNYHYPFLPHARALGLDVPSYKLATFIIHCSWMTHALGTRLQPKSGELDFCGHLLSLIPTGVNPSESMEAFVAGITDGCRYYAGEQLPRLLVHFQKAAWGGQEADIWTDSTPFWV